MSDSDGGDSLTMENVIKNEGKKTDRHDDYDDDEDDDEDDDNGDDNHVRGLKEKVRLKI